MSSFEHVNFAINGKYSQKCMIIQIIVFTCDFSYIQKCSFKECPLTWVTPLIMFLPSHEWMELHCFHNYFYTNSRAYFIYYVG
jgi:hypothetical protein